MRSPTFANFYKEKRSATAKLLKISCNVDRLLPRDQRQYNEIEALVESAEIHADENGVCSLTLGASFRDHHVLEELQAAGGSAPASAGAASVPTGPIYCCCARRNSSSERVQQGDPHESTQKLLQSSQFHTDLPSEIWPSTPAPSGRTWRVLCPAQFAALRPVLMSHHELNINAFNPSPAAPDACRLRSGCRRFLLQRHHSDTAFAQLHGAAVHIVLAHDSLVFTAHQDHKIRVWKKHNGNYHLINTLPTRRDYLLNSFFQHNYVQLRRHHHRLWMQHVDTISALAFHKGSSYSCDTKLDVCKINDHIHWEPLLYSASWDKTFKVWSLSNFKCIESVAAHDDAINAIALGSCYDAATANQQLAFTASSDGTVKAWAKEAVYTDRFMRKSCLKVKHKLVATLAHPKKCAVNALAISNDVDIGLLLFSAGSDGFIRIWRRVANHYSKQLLQEEGSGSQKQVNMTLCSVLEGHKRAVLCLSIAGDLLLSGSADNTLRVWSIRQAKAWLSSNSNNTADQTSSIICYSALVAMMEGHKAPVKSICASPCPHGCGYYAVFSGALDEAIKVWCLH
ncbi:hypothetical protein GOP47_0014231 [Adiantum capillus-veneris]|uniref:Uncharacterized protein n=1 Tax=Adiantum capillus-veneris TaxID=13818 RepID=A0A9D4ZG70_ADICA|nr:hypothetical protein GOP47_0014231 [Adiantum capillus-veneris]